MRKSTITREITQEEKVLLDTLRSRKYQRVNVVISDGVIQTINQEISIKPDPKQKNAVS